LKKDEEMMKRRKFTPL